MSLLNRSLCSCLRRPGVGLRSRPALLRPHLRRQVVRTRTYNSGGQYFYPPPEPNPYIQKSALIWAMIAANCAVFGATVYCKVGRPDPSDFSGRRRDHGYSDSYKKWVAQLLQRYFILDTDTTKSSDRYLSLFGSTFFHLNLAHLAVNMFSLRAISGLFFITPISVPVFSTLLLGSGLSGSIFFLYEAGKSGQHHRAAGASGIVAGVLSAAALLYPNVKLNYFFFNARLWVVALLYFAYDSYNLNNPTSVIGHAGHLGGAGFGAAFYLLFLRRFGGIFPAFRR